MSCSCGNKKPAVPVAGNAPARVPALVLPPVRLPAPLLRAPVRAPLVPSPARTLPAPIASTLRPAVATTFRDMDGTDMTDAANLPASQWPEVREPVNPDGSPLDPSQYGSSSSSSSSSGGVVFTDPARVSAYNSPLGQALERLAAIFTGSTTP